MIGTGDNTQELSPLTREALAWVVLLRSGDVSTDDLEDLKLWRAQSPAHEEAFRYGARLWKDLKHSADEIILRGEYESPERDHSPRRSGATRRALLGSVMAAPVVGYLLYRPPLDLWPSLGEMAADYRTAKGERRTVAIAEGVSVTLNTQTSVTTVPGKNGLPQINLVQGEAAVTAALAPREPLVVQAAGTRILATRASFNARCIGGVVSVSCLDGDVAIQQGEQAVPLQKGQEVRVASGKLGDPVSSDVGEAEAWRNGLLIVRGRQLTDVVEEVNRYRSGRLIVTNAQLGRRVVNGTFHIDRLDDFPGQVRQLFGASLRSLPGGVVLLS